VRLYFAGAGGETQFCRGVTTKLGKVVRRFGREFCVRRDLAAQASAS
jgi:hypothetical protein